MLFPNRSKFYSLLSTSALATSLVLSGCSSSGKQEAKTSASQTADAQLAGEIQARISGDPTLSANQHNSIGVNVRGGVVTLTGWVTNDNELTAALNAAQGVEGVKQVVSRLQVGQEFAAMPGAAAAAAEAPEQAEPRYASVASSRKPTPARAVAKPVVKKSSPTYATNGGVSGNGAYSPSSAVNTQPYSAAGESSTMGSNSSGSVTPYSQSNPQAVQAMPAVEREPQRINIPAGTEIPVRLIDALSSETSNPDQIWRGTVNGDIVVDDRVVIPSGSEVEGRIVDVKKSTHYTGAAQLTLQLSKIQMGGKSYTVASDQWTRKAAARGTNTAKKVGTGAAVGAVLGGIFGGGKGAAIGAAAGGGAGAGANTVTKGEKVELDSESLIMFRLASSVNVVPVAARERYRSEASSDPAPYVPQKSSTSDDPYRPVLKRR